VAKDVKKDWESLVVLVASSPQEVRRGARYIRLAEPPRAKRQWEARLWVFW